jgi:hypothetical protein
MIQTPKTKGYSICPFAQGETTTMKVLNGTVLAPHICINFVCSFPTEFLQKTFTHFHEGIDIHIWFDASFFLSSADFLHQFVICANPLTSSREIQCLTNCHFTDMKIFLANVSCRFLRYKFMLCVSIECNLSCDLQCPSINVTNQYFRQVLLIVPSDVYNKILMAYF